MEFILSSASFVLLLWGRKFTRELPGQLSGQNVVGNAHGFINPTQSVFDLKTIFRFA